VPLLAEFGYRAISLDDAGIAERPEENDIECFDTFEENACAKARYFAERSGGRLVLADDSGLCVDSLGGAPGVLSKRWAGSRASGQALDDDNNAKLLAELGSCDGAARGAAYVCVAAIAHEGSRSPRDVHRVDRERSVHWARGETRGVIAREPQGSNGFGYDPYFVSDDLGKAFGIATREEKARVSHRARAVRAACQQWAEHAHNKTLADS
jgi:XTP/dITP diphosphohydrolase